MDRQGLIRSIRNTLLAIAGGVVLTYATAWACVGWMPTTRVVPIPSTVGPGLEKSSPDGERRLMHEEGGLGWRALAERGIVVEGRAEGTFKSRSRSPYFSTDHHLAGWPIAALRSRVRMLDPPGSVPVRRYWQPFWNETVFRGVATDDLPAILRAQPDRRLPLVPVWPGFVVNALIYTGLCVAVGILGARLFRRLRPVSRGFAVEPSPGIQKTEPGSASIR